MTLERPPCGVADVDGRGDDPVTTTPPPAGGADLVSRILPLLTEDGVLGLGEPTHGSANAFDWKFEVICDLASRGLLAALAFEDSFVVGTRVDAALRSGGDLEDAWHDAMSVWRTQSIMAGLRRLRRINGMLPADARVRFIGLDSRRPDLAATTLLDAGYECDALRRMAEKQELDAQQTLRAQETSTRAAGSPDEQVAAAARQMLRRIEAYLLEPDLKDLYKRDTHMAETLLENLPGRGITVVWAHNEHVARSPDNWGGPSMGQVLAEQLGTRYAAVGILCGEGACRAVDPSTGDTDFRSVALPPAHADTTDAALRDLDTDFVTAKEFAHPGPRRFIGWRVDHSLAGDADRSRFEAARPSTDFDALAYLPTSIADTTWECETDFPA